MKKQISFIIIFFGLFSLFTNAENKNYVTNRQPLIEASFYPLPLGTVKAEGWLLKQLELQRDGLTGNAETLYNSANDLGQGSDWLGQSGNSWERAPYYVKGLVPLAYLLNDNSLITKAKKWIDWSINNQQKDGFFGPKNNTDWWPRMPMLYAIRDYYEATNDKRVIPFFTKYFQYQNANLENNPLNSWSKSRAGDNIELVLWLYNHTGDSFLLDLADKLKNEAYDWTDIFTNNKFMWYGTDFQPKHNVNITQAIKMPAIYFQKSGNQADKNAYNIGHEHLMHDHGQPEGLQSGNEMINGKSAMTGVELCAIVEQMQSAETAQMILGDPLIGDELEEVVFNALPGSLSKDIKGLQYYTQANQVKSKFGNGNFGQEYDNGLLPGAFSGYGCCRFNMHMGWPYFTKNMWAATNDNGLAAMAYGPCKVTARVADDKTVSIEEQTNYPFDERLCFKISSEQSVEFPLKLRIPSWCDNPEILVNGTKQNGVIAGSFYSIQRVWNNGDSVELFVPMKIKLNKEVNQSVSIHRGPLVYALKIAENWIQRTDYGNGFKEYEVLPNSDWNYGLEIDTTNLASCFTIHKSTMPENPFVQSTTPITLSVNAKKIPEWNYTISGLFACDPPYGPIQSDQTTKEVTLVPFGAENLRISCFPLIGNRNNDTDTFYDNFDSGTQDGWVNYSGSFMVQNGEYIATNTEGYSGSKSIWTAASFSDFVYDFSIKVGNSGDGGVVFRTNKVALGADDYSGYYAGISAVEGNIILGKANGKWTLLSSIPFKVEANQWYKMRVEVTGPTIKIYLNDLNVPQLTYTDHTFTEGMIGVRSYNAVTYWDDLHVTTSNKSGIQNITATSNKVRIYPNPTKNKIEIDFDSQINGVVDLNIYSDDGTLIQKQRINADSTKLKMNIARLNAGIYFLKASVGKEIYKCTFVKK